MITELSHYKRIAPDQPIKHPIHANWERDGRRCLRKKLTSKLGKEMKALHEISCCGDMVRVRSSHLREGSLRINTKLFWVITFILWWNTSVLLGTVSSVITMSHPEGLTELCDEYGNDLKHTLQPWQSLDLNPAERLWEILDWQHYLPTS